MSRFRPCIDLHDGKVKQIVGKSLADRKSPVENFISDRSAADYAARYRDDQIPGGHVIKLGSGNDEAAKAALAAYPGGLQIGGGINLKNAASWLDAGASHVIVTSWLFNESGQFDPTRLKQLVKSVGANRIVLDLSCRTTESGWKVAMNRWQTLTDLSVTHETLDRLASSCNEFLIHAADVEGLCSGVDEELVQLLGTWGKIPMTYAGGIRDLSDVELVHSVGQGNLDFTVGSALDLFGGTGIRYDQLLAWNQQQENGTV